MNKKPLVRCRGRNGFFAYDQMSCSHVGDLDSGEPRVYLEFYSKQIGRSAPIQLMGHPEDVKALLLEALDKVDPVETKVTPKPKKHWVGFLMGSQQSAKEEREFDTEAEVAAFCDGINAGEGWMDISGEFTEETREEFDRYEQNEDGQYVLPDEEEDA